MDKLKLKFALIRLLIHTSVFFVLFSIVNTSLMGEQFDLTQFLLQAFLFGATVTAYQVFIQNKIKK